MDYEEAIAFLRDLGKFGSNLGLGRTQALLEATGKPHRRLKAIHVAGTNGKGSVAAMVDSILRAAGFSVGLYTSPHLSCYTERIRVNGKDIPRASVADIMTALEPLFRAVSEEPSLGPPTEFEMGTVMAFLHFERESVDYAVIEVGMGGRFDATNVISPLVSIITHVDMDHADRLGSTIGQIAFEKAGIIKPGVPVVVGRQEEAALAVIRAVAEERASPLTILGRDVTFERTGRTAELQTLRVTTGGGLYDGLEIPLLGAHQAENAATAVAAIETLHTAGCDVPAEAVKRGLARVRWPGRLEILQREPLVLVDGAHNLDGMRALRTAVRESAAGRPVTAVVGVSRDKPVEGMLREVASFASSVIATRASCSRLGGVEPAVIASLALREGRASEVEADPVRAVDRGLAIAGQDGALVVCGSLYLVGEVRNHLLSVAGTLPASRRLVVFCGAYGSGKTEVALNFAASCGRRGERVLLVDLDIVNRYFRSREAAEAMARLGVDVVSSVSGFEAADLPALSPRILQAFHNDDMTVVFDAGGDPTGARALGVYARRFEDAGYDMYFVLNLNRPFTRDIAGAARMMRSIEEMSRMSFTGIVSNTHMSADTTPEEVRRGALAAGVLAAEANLPVVFACTRGDLRGKIDGSLATRLMSLELYMRPPWE